jgi:Fe-only nitrogenase accessory protein AnfO
MNKIAVLIGKNEETTTFDKEAVVEVFLKKGGEWEVIQKIEVVLEESMGIAEVRQEAVRIAKALGDCRLIVGKKVYGMAYNVFETMKFAIWEIEGRPETFLDEVVEQEEAYVRQKMDKANEKLTEESYIKKLDEGHYLIDLLHIQSLDRSISSKQAIIPFLEKQLFERLDIVCTHIPPWIETQIEKYAVRMKIEGLDNGNYKVILLKNSY